MYSDDDVAALYERLNGWDPSDDFYLDLVIAAPSALDVGCGPGAILRRARERGHAGPLCGVDPDPTMLNLARRRSDIEWQLSTAATMSFDQEFDLAIMTGHAFQVLVADDELRASLATIQQALVDGGRFAFETRNPRGRAWEDWTPENATTVTDASGRPVRVSYEVEWVVDDVVTLTETTSDARGGLLRVDRADLRFLDETTLARFLTEAGFEITRQYGGWSGEPLVDDCLEIITIARTRR